MSKRRLTQAEVGELVSLEQELAALKMEHGVRDRQGPIERLLAGYYAFKDSHIKKNPVRGLIYLALCWTGLPLAFGLVDWMEALPKQTDEEGCILV